ncbi:hypothetical protein ABIE58_003082 [Roseovarius sp. MBR-78]|jgi:hypothetical protein
MVGFIHHPQTPDNTKEHRMPALKLNKVGTKGAIKAGQAVLA